MLELAPLKGFEEKYLIDTLGSISSIDSLDSQGRKLKGALITVHPDKKGYIKAVLRYKGKQSNHLLHRLVALTFIPNPDNKPQVNHIDGDKANNCVDNLEWCTGSENVTHALANGLKIAAKGEAHPRSKISDVQAHYCVWYLEAGMRPKEVSAILNIAYATVADIACGRKWKQIPRISK